MNKEINEVITATVNEAVIQLKKNALISKHKQTPFQKVESLLYNYNNFINAIHDKEQQIEELKKYGVPKKSNSITSYGGNGGLITTKTESEKLEERINALNDSIRVTKGYVSVLDNALNDLKDDPYIDIISMKYFERMSREEIADELGVDASTVTRNKNRLIDALQIKLFSDEVITRIFLS